MVGGVVLISIRDGEGDSANPYRTGTMVILSEQLVRETVKPHDMAEKLLWQRAAFLEERLWAQAGLPVAPSLPREIAIQEGGN
jgi:hypothetical protein